MPLVGVELFFRVSFLNPTFVILWISDKYLRICVQIFIKQCFMAKTIII